MLKYKTDWAKEALAAQTRSGAASVHQGDVGGDSARAGEGEREGGKDCSGEDPVGEEEVGGEEVEEGGGVEGNRISRVGSGCKARELETEMCALKIQRPSPSPV